MIGHNNTGFRRSKITIYVRVASFLNETFFFPSQSHRKFALAYTILNQHFWWTYWANPNQIVYPFGSNNSRRIGWQFVWRFRWYYLNMNYERFDSVPISCYLFRWLTHNRMHTHTQTEKRKTLIPDSMLKWGVAMLHHGNDGGFFFVFHFN